MPLVIDLQVAADVEQVVPPQGKFQLWADAAASACANIKNELSIRVVGFQESAEFNLKYRKKEGPTNVLSFPFEDPPGVLTDVMGDLLICAPVVLQEADEQGKTAEQHWAHMLVHGVLHLCGYDHLKTAEAEEMEALETRILVDLGYPQPYDE